MSGSGRLSGFLRKILLKGKGKEREPVASSSADGPLHGTFIATTTPLDPTTGTVTITNLRPSRICAVCYNLSTKEAQRAGYGNLVDVEQKTWVDLEYKDRPSTSPAAKIRIEQSKALLASAQSGCLYCAIIRKAFGTAHPGWESEQTYIHIFLAPGLPVIVRLDYGATSSGPIGEASSLPWGSPEGRSLGFQISIAPSEPKRSGLELEIYRPWVSLNQLQPGNTSLLSFVEEIGFGKERAKNSSDQQCLKFIKEQIAHCVGTHNCNQNNSPPLLPDRVVWIDAPSPSRIQLLEPRGTRAEYIALSYCWGTLKSNTYLTTNASVKARKDGIEFADLPPLFQDIVTLARHLGVDYIWIDRLCIIQGSDADFAEQAPKMGDIYGNATLTLAAATGTSENDRILGLRDKTWQAYDADINIPGIGTQKLRIRRVSHELGTEARGGDYGKLSTRAWTWQERLLASRTVFFTPSAIKYECRQHSRWEGSDVDGYGHSWSGQLEKIDYDLWMSLVEEFMSRDITRASDRLPAMTSVINRIASGRGWKSRWGMWLDNMVENLAWRPSPSREFGRHTCRINPGDYAPTWSWVSVDGPISYQSARSWANIDPGDPLCYDIKVEGLVVKSGRILLHGSAGKFILHGTIRRDKMKNKKDSKNEKFLHDYEIRGIQEESGIYFEQDVLLQPWSGEIGGEHVSTAIRLPHGQPAPQRSWKGDCICMLFGKRKLRSLVLVLGPSVRQPGAWERLGIAAGFLTEPFLHAPKHTYHVI
ncbi:heterokaryon incompatibility protein-domain-containing protein [Xylariales sp. PMI_506]|nr:heterokaryon incompatibility protein-domain-containing protein [Xylariales sp. PMI_506]